MPHGRFRYAYAMIPTASSVHAAEAGNSETTRALGKLDALRSALRDFGSAAVAFSAGVDSTFLLLVAHEVLGEHVVAVTVRAPFVPPREIEEAVTFCRRVGVKHVVLDAPLADIPLFAENPPDRCYHCKVSILSAIRERAGADGYELILDGTNASDDAGDRPGMRALREFGVLSPLRLCGLTKDEIRRRSREASLPTWDKPAYACLATRIPTGTEITSSLLKRVEGAETALLDLGYRDFRVRVFHDAARLQLLKEQMSGAAEGAELLRSALAPWFKTVLLDLEGR
jgi:uncharacterized protein